MRIAVLGATGQVGSCIVEQLKDDYPKGTIIACSRTSKSGYFLFNPWMDNWTVLGNIDVLINCIGIIEETKTFSFEKVHEGITNAMIQNRSAIGNPRIIQISANGADSNSPYPYHASKGRADEALLNEGNTYVIKPSVICTSGAAMVKQLRKSRTISRILLNTMPFPKANFKIRLQPDLDSDLAELVSELCAVDSAPRTIIAVGNDIITVRQLLRLLNRYMLVIPVSKKLFDQLFKILGPILKSVITKTQYELLSNDNVGDPKPMEEILGRQVKGTIGFWKEEFR